MIYEWRVYEIMPGKRNELHDRFINHILKLFKKHNIQIIGFWESVVGGSSNTLYYMLTFRDLAHLEEAWRSFDSDPEWLGVLKQGEKMGPLVARITSMALRPTPYSPLQ